MKQFSFVARYALLGALAGLCFVPGASAQQDVISTFAGGGPNGIPAVNANLNNPLGMAIDKQGNYYIAGAGQNRVYKVSPTGIISTIAGTGARNYSGDGGQATAATFNSPQAVAVDNANPANVYISDSGNCLVRKITASTGIITTIAGFVNHPTTGNPYPSCGYSGDGGAADAAELNSPQGIALNPTTNDLYITEYNNGRVRLVAGGTATGKITTYAGGGGSTTNSNNCQGSVPYGDGGPANQSYLCQTNGIAIDTSVSPVNVFISDTSHCVVREVVGSTGKIYQIAGTYGVCNFLDGVAANTGRLNSPSQLQLQVASGKTTVTVADFSNWRIRQFSVTLTGGVPTPGTITTIAGNGGYFSGDGGPATMAGMVQPWGIVFDPTGNLYVADFGDNHVRKVTKSSGFISTVSGWGPGGSGQTNYSDPVAITNVSPTGVALHQPFGLFADPVTNDLYIGGQSSENVYLNSLATGKLSNFAGNGIAGFVGDGSSATNPGAELNAPQGIARDSNGNVYIADAGNCIIREVSASTGIISTVVGTPNRCGYSGDNGVATSAQLNGPDGIAIDANNNIFISEYWNCTVRRVDASTHIITTYVGTGTGACGYNGDGEASNAELNRPYGIALDGSGNLYIADYNNSRVRKVDANFGTISTIAGDGVGGYTKDGVATATQINGASGVAADQNGNVFLSDYYNDLLRWVDPAGTMVTFAGIPGANGFSGDGGPATSAMFYYPTGIAQDSAGNFYTADYNNDRIRKVSAFAGYGRSTGELIFPKQGIGTTSEFQPVILSAIGPVTINTISVTAGFAEYDDCAGAQLVAGETCEVDVYFTPQKAGEVKGTLSITSDALLAQGSTVNLSGTGDGLSVSGSLAFGFQTVGTSSSQTVTIVNSGPAVTLRALTLAKAVGFAISGGTCPATGGLLAANGSCTIAVTFAPKMIGPLSNALQVRSTDAVSPILVPITGSGAGFTLSATSLAFSSTVVGSPETLNLTITNVSSAALILTSQISGSGAAAFAVANTGNTCGTSVAASKSCTLPVTFNPSAAGPFTAGLVLTTNGGFNPTVNLTGTATASVQVSTTTLAFGNETVGSSLVSNLTITNLGKQTLTVTEAISGTNSSVFTVLKTVANTCQSGVPAGQSCTLPVQFLPTATVSYTATLTLATNGGTNPTVTLTGTGTALVTATPATLAFGTVKSGKTSVMNVSITNNGAATIGVGSFVSTTAPFSELFNSSNTCGNGLAPNKTCTIPIQFAPTSNGSSAAILTINAGATTLYVHLTGTGD